MRPRKPRTWRDGDQYVIAFSPDTLVDDLGEHAAPAAALYDSTVSACRLLLSVPACAQAARVRLHELGAGDSTPRDDGTLGDAERVARLRAKAGV